MKRKRKQKKPKIPAGFKPVLRSRSVPQPGYEAVSDSSVEALMATDVSRVAQRFYDLIVKAGPKGMTRLEILRTNPDCNLKNVTARIAELRKTGWVRHKVTKVGGKRTVLRRVDPETGNANTVVVAVPHFEETFTDTRFAALRLAYKEALVDQERYLAAALEAKEAALEYLRRIHVKLRKIHAKGT